MQTMKTVMGQRMREQEREVKVSEARDILEEAESARVVSEELVRAHTSQTLDPMICKLMATTPPIS